MTVRIAGGRVPPSRCPPACHGRRSAAPAKAPPGRVRAPSRDASSAVNVREGDSVRDGDIVAVLDAMKMEHAIPAPGAGAVKAVHVAPDEVVEAGALLVELE